MIDQSHRYAVILAGGRGTRLWPISTPAQPKQFQALGDSQSLIAKTFDQLAKCVGTDRIFVSTTTEYVDDVTASLPGLKPGNLIAEPRPIGKAAAFLLVASHLLEHDPEAVVFSAAADSSVAPFYAFRKCCNRAFEFVEKNPSWTTILGIRPSRLDSSLGYIRARDTALGTEGIFVADSFEEKPAQKSGDQTLGLGADSFWNTSYYCFSAATWVDAYTQRAPELARAVHSFMRTGLNADYASKDAPAHELLPLVDGGRPIGVVDCDFRWYDVGTWPSLYRALRDSQGGDIVSSGKHLDDDSSGSLVVNDSGMTVVTAALSDLAVIVSDSVIFIMPISQLEERPESIARLQAMHGRLSEDQENVE